MHAYLTLLRRELGAFFVSFTGYIIIALALSQVGLSLVMVINGIKGMATPMPLVELFFLTPFFWILQLLTAPIITMRLFALEKSTGTFETLMTAPVSDLQVVLAKFSAAMLFYLAMWLPFLGSLAMLHGYTNDAAGLDVGALASTYFGLFLLGSLFLSFGCLASALTRNQIVAAMISFAFVMSLFIVSTLAGNIASMAGGLASVLQHVNLLDHIGEFSRGVVDSRWVTFYVSATFLFLFLTHRVVESRRWK